MPGECYGQGHYGYLEEGGNVGPAGPTGDTGAAGAAGASGATGAAGAAGSPAKYTASGIDLLATGATLLVPASAGKLFIPHRAILHVRALTGVLLAGAVVRVGNSANKDNVCALFTLLTTLVVNGLVDVPLLAVPSFQAVDVNSTGISFEVQTAGTATAWTADVHLHGVLV